uniref:Protein LURP-one-related 7 n=1 Tax=Rhizophora mucronata TaxID=61149 RepID=A0A2P2IL34_RHIMU
MASSAAEPKYQAAASSHIPVDLFISKKHPGLARGDLGFADSSGNIVFRAIRHASSGSQKSSDHSKRLVLDAFGNPLFSICRTHKGSWQAFKGADDEEKDSVFRVQRTLNKFMRTELEAFLVGENIGVPTSDLKVKGFPFKRSCTIYTGNSIVAQVFSTIICSGGSLKLPCKNC